MTDSGFTEAQLAALEKAIANGVRRVTADGRTVEYGSPAEMIALRDRMIRELRGAAPSRTSFATFNGRR